MILLSFKFLYSILLMFEHPLVWARPTLVLFFIYNLPSVCFIFIHQRAWLVYSQICKWNMWVHTWWPRSLELYPVHHTLDIISPHTPTTSIVSLHVAGDYRSWKTFLSQMSLYFWKREIFLFITSLHNQDLVSLV